MLNTNVTGLPTVVSVSSNTISFVGNNDISGTFRVGAGPNYVYIDNLQLNNNGLIYVIIGTSAAWDRDPVIS